MHRNSIEDSISIHFNTSAISFRMETENGKVLMLASDCFSLSQEIKFWIGRKKRLKIILLQFFLAFLYLELQKSWNFELESLSPLREIKEIIDDLYDFSQR